MKALAIKLDKVSKKYLFQPERPTIVRNLFSRKKEYFYALKNISIEIGRGEKIGILGPNGSGKTTLLKMLAGITLPSEGNIQINGKLVSIIDLEAGFHPEFTGRENIYVNGMLLGMKREEIRKKKERIIRYAGLGRFIELPLYTYSQGMKLRLGLSIALHADSDIILLDESLGVGDRDFKEKIRNEKKLLFNDDKTIIMASHNLYAIVDFCDKVIVLNKGKIVKVGGLEALKYYEKGFTYEYQPPSKRQSSLLSRQLLKNHEKK